MKTRILNMNKTADSFRAAFNRWEVLVSRWQPDSGCQFA